MFLNTDIITPLLFINKQKDNLLVIILKVVFIKCVKFENVTYKLVFLKGLSALF